MDDHERRVSAQEDEVERQLRLGQHAQLLPDLFEAMEAEPLRERRALQLMLAFYRSGKPLDGFIAFGRFRRALAGFGLEPSDEAYELDYKMAIRCPELEWVGPDSIAY